jgi:hypothetical protein
LQADIFVFFKINFHFINELLWSDPFSLEPSEFYIMDRGFLDFKRLYRLHTAGSFFVIRAKGNQQVKWRYSHPVDRSSGLICDQTVVLTGFYSPKAYKELFRRIHLKDPDTDKMMVFLVNNFTQPALMVTEWKIVNS